MVDVLTKKQRSAVMGSVKNKNTKPELVVRKTTFSLGYRYRLYRSDLPGRPDLVFPRKKKIIFVHGCFWHGHHGCPSYRPPKSNINFWNDKIVKNRENDRRAIYLLKKQGWRVLVLWECQIINSARLRSKIDIFLKDK